MPNDNRRLREYMHLKRDVQIVEMYMDTPNSIHRVKDIAKAFACDQSIVHKAIARYHKKPTQDLCGINSGIDTKRAIDDNRYKIKDVRNKEHYFVLDVVLLKQNT